MLRVLSAYIQASRLYLHQQVTANTGVIAAATSTGDAAKVNSRCCSYFDTGRGRGGNKESGCGEVADIGRRGARIFSLSLSLSLSLLTLAQKFVDLF